MLSCLCRGVLVDARAPCLCYARALRAKLAAAEDPKVLLDSVSLKSPRAATTAATPPLPSAFKALCVPPSLDDARRVAVAGFEAALDYRFRSGQLRISEAEVPLRLELKTSPAHCYPAFLESHTTVS